MNTPSFTDNDEMPIVGLGTWKSAPGEVYEAVRVALDAGYRHVDCAPIYGNEAEVGRALSESFDAGVVSRDDVWVTSKLWNSAHAPEDVRPALQQTLDDLQLDVLDLFLIHWPIAFETGVDMPESADDFVPLEERPIAETWAAMEELVDDGLVRHIGVSNFSVSKLKALLDDARIAPEMNQVELHPYLQQNDLLEFARANDVHLTAYSPLGSSDRPEGMKKEDDPILLEDPTIHKIAERHDATPAQVLISWAVHRGTAVIPKSVTPSRIRENLAAADVSLTDADMDAIADLDRHRRYLDGAFFDFEGNTYSADAIWS